MNNSLTNNNNALFGLPVKNRGDNGGYIPVTISDMPEMITTTFPDSSLLQQYRPMPGSIFHLACVFFFLAFMAGGQKEIAAIYTHTLCACSFLSLAIWAGVDACALDIIIWSLVLVVINIFQVIYISYKSKNMEKVFDHDMQNIYHKRFAPFNISPHVFYELVTCKGCNVLKLEKGHRYAAEGKTPIEKLSLLLSGKIKVSSEGKFLHYISGNEFIDSPEWDSNQSAANSRSVYKVTVTAETDCHYITWKRKPLLNLLTKRQRLGKLMRYMIGRDVVKKLYALNARQFNSRGYHYDIRLPCIMSLREEVLEREKKRQEALSQPETPGRRHRKLGKKASEHYARLFARRMSERISMMKDRKQSLKKITS